MSEQVLTITHYQATLGIPESSVYSLVNMIIGFDCTMSIEKGVSGFSWLVSFLLSV